MAYADMHVYIDGEKIKEEESKLLGDILSRTSIDFAAYGIDIEQVIGARSDLTYEEVQLVLSEYPITHYLSQNLNEMLQSSEIIYYICVCMCV